MRQRASEGIFASLGRKGAMLIPESGTWGFVLIWKSNKDKVSNFVFIWKANKDKIVLILRILIK